MTELIRAFTRNKLVRYAFAGGSSLATEELALFLCHGLGGLPLWFATTVAFVTSFAVNFTLNRVLTFADNGAREGGVHGQTIRFGILVGFNYTVTQMVMYALTGAGVNYLVAKIMVTGIVTTYNFPVYKFWVFKAPAAPRGEPAAVAAEPDAETQADAEAGPAQPAPAADPARIRA